MMKHSFRAVRHGLTFYNIEKRCQGRTDNPMTPEGFRQAAEAAAKLKGLKFDAIYCSPTLRTRQTLDMVTNVIAGAPVFFDERLGYSYGDFEGVLQSDMPADVFHDFYHNPHKYHADTYEDMYINAKEIINEIKRKHKGEILIVTHGIIINILQFIEQGGEWNLSAFEKLLEKHRNVSSTIVHEFNL
jgi:broad specificity phosphatase PhoE